MEPIYALTTQIPREFQLLLVCDLLCWMMSRLAPTSVFAFAVFTLFSPLFLVVSLLFSLPLSAVQLFLQYPNMEVVCYLTHFWVFKLFYSLSWG